MRGGGNHWMIVRNFFINTHTNQQVPWNIIDADLANNISVKQMNNLNQQGFFLVNNLANNDYFWISTDEFRNLVFEVYFKNSNDTYGI
jgi:hypothetical protein